MIGEIVVFVSDCFFRGLPSYSIFYCYLTLLDVLYVRLGDKMKEGGSFTTSAFLNQNLNYEIIRFTLNYYDGKDKGYFENSKLCTCVLGHSLRTGFTENTPILPIYQLNMGVSA